MKILDYLLYASCRPCSHYIPRPRKSKSKWYRNRKRVHELGVSQLPKEKEKICIRK